MKRVNILLKPVSDSCNLDCNYCFYKGKSANLFANNSCHMSLITAKTVVKSAIEAADEGISLILQGGEPMLLGKEAIDELASYARSSAPDKMTVELSIQTNGTLIDEEWAGIFKRHDFLVGLSIDGWKELNDRQRSNSTDEVLRAAKILRCFGVRYNVLSVITEDTLPFPSEYFSSLACHRYLQPIPVHKKSGGLDALKYGEFLCGLFDCYFDAIMSGDPISILPFDSILMIMLYGRSGSCVGDGRCGGYLVVEADGSVYPCDFYVEKDLCLGNVNTQSIAELALSEKAKEFIKESYRIDKKCRECRWLTLCRGGCKKLRLNNAYLYCESYKMLFEYAFNKFIILKKELEKEKRNG